MDMLAGQVTNGGMLRHDWRAGAVNSSSAIVTMDPGWLAMLTSRWVVCYPRIPCTIEEARALVDELGDAFDAGWSDPLVLVVAAVDDAGDRWIAALVEGRLLWFGMGSLHKLVRALG